VQETNLDQTKKKRGRFGNRQGVWGGGGGEGGAGRWWVFWGDLGGGGLLYVSILGLTHWEKRKCSDIVKAGI